MKSLVKIIPIEYSGYYYYLSVEEEDDNRKNYHYAVNRGTKKRILLNYDPYDCMTRTAFRELVEKL